MLFNVPQYIDVEDKVAGPLTAKQLLWMIGMGAALMVLWSTLEKGIFIVAAIPVGGAFIAMAFYRPYGRPLTSFIGSGATYLFSPKIYSWKRIHRARKIEKSASQEDRHAHDNKVITESVERDIVELAKLLDTEGRERSGRIQEIIKEKQKKST